MRKKHTNLSKFLPGVAAVAILILIAAGIATYAPTGSRLAPSTAKASTAALTGWAWSSNIGWISFSGTASNGTTYGVMVGAGGVLSGYAWGDNIGWINFGGNTTTCGRMPTLANGSLTGFAQAINTGSDGCLSLSGTASNGTPYGITLSGTTLSGYAWASDTIGWLNFSGTASNGTTYAVQYGGAPAPTCTLSVAPNPATTGSAITLNYTTTNSPSTGTITDAGGTTLTTSATNPSGGIAATAPSSAGSYTYNMTVSSPSGSGSCSASLSAQTDICTDIGGLQSTLPPGCAGPSPSSPGTCIPSGYTWNGSACIVVNPTINSFGGPTRVRKGNPATLTYTVTNPTSCTITGTNGYNSGAFTPTSGVQGQVTTTAITANTLFTLTCSSISQTITVGIDPTVQEI